jgi:glycine C-acetyltransferase
LLDEGVFVIGFGFPVVPKGEARVRCQISAAHETAHLDRALEALEVVGKRLGVI